MLEWELWLFYIDACPDDDGAVLDVLIKSVTSAFISQMSVGGPQEAGIKPDASADGGLPLF